jgi:hypothetical protein
MEAVMRLADVKRILVYKRTHDDDPDDQGRFGVCDCMRSVRTWKFDAVIGVGGIGAQAKSNDIAGKITWIGIGRHEDGWYGHGPILIFDHFRHFGTKGPLLSKKAKRLATWVYSRNVRRIMDSMTSQQYSEAMKILRLAISYPPSQRNVLNTNRARAIECR